MTTAEPTDAVLSPPESGGWPSEEQLHFAVSTFLATYKGNNGLDAMRQAIALFPKDRGGGWRAALETAQAYIDELPHGENCFLLNDGGEFDRCRCGKDAMVQYIEDVLVFDITPTPSQIRIDPPAPSQEGWRDLSCDEQRALAERIAGNIGYVLTPEPPHPDSPHTRAAPSLEGEGALREALEGALRLPIIIEEQMELEDCGGEADREDLERYRKDRIAILASIRSALSALSTKEGKEEALQGSEQT